MKDDKEVFTMRANFECTGPEWQKFKKLSKDHGITVHAAFTKMFFKSIELMENNKSLWSKLDDGE